MINKEPCKQMMLQPMGVEHVDQVLAIEQKSFPTPWTRSAFVQEVTDNNFATYLVALHEGEVVGYGGMWLIVDEAHITTLAVHPEHRRKKIAQALLGHLFGKARIEGAVAITLEVRTSNTEAQSLYLKLGFVPRGYRKGYYSDTGEDAIIMWKYYPARSHGGKD